jgi:hypothetical protein
MDNVISRDVACPISRQARYRFFGYELTFDETTLLGLLEGIGVFANKIRVRPNIGQCKGGYSFANIKNLCHFGEEASG